MTPDPKTDDPRRQTKVRTVEPWQAVDILINSAWLKKKQWTS